MSRNLALAFASALLTYVACEIAVARLLLDRVPLDRQEFLSGELRVLAQSSKRGIVPRPGYILLTGDSYAAGAGDWLLEADPGRNGPFHSAHVLHQRTGRDVLSLGRSGWGSLEAFAAGPRDLRCCFERLLLFHVPEPGLVLLYFYEGNDLDDNIRRLEAGPPAACARCGLSHNLVFAGLFGRLLKGNAAASAPSYRPFASSPVAPGDASPNVAIVQGKPVTLPLGLQSPSLDLTHEQVGRALDVLGRSLADARATFPGSRLALVYIPSPLSSYTLASPRVSAQTYYPEGVQEYPASLVPERSDAIASAVARACERNGIPFLDVRPAVKAATQQHLLHGPRDWKHFNRLGYTVLADAIARELPRLESR